MELYSNLRAPEAVAVNAITTGLNRMETRGQWPEGTTFEIWRRHGDTVDWYLHATGAGTSYEDTDVEPGQYYEYKVRAVIGDRTSEFSPSAVVYGK